MEIKGKLRFLFYIPFINYLFLDDNKAVVLCSRTFTGADDFMYITYYNLMYVFGYIIIY